MIKREQLHAFQNSSNESAYQIVTQNFSDISLNLVAWLCKKDTFLTEYLEHADNHYFAFVNLAHIVMHLESPHVDKHLRLDSETGVPDIKKHWHRNLCTIHCQ